MGAGDVSTSSNAVTSFAVLSTVTSVLVADADLVTFPSLTVNEVVVICLWFAGTVVSSSVYSPSGSEILNWVVVVFQLMLFPSVDTVTLLPPVCVSTILLKSTLLVVVLSFIVAPVSSPVDA